MCAIIGWSGKLPTGLLYRLLHHASTRGIDSTGLGFLDQSVGLNKLYKRAVSPAFFCKHNSDAVSQAQKSPYGIAHTRRASKGMPVDNYNAHPFAWGSHIYAHNGAVRNWQTLKPAIEKAACEPNSPEWLTKYASRLTTDSMTLGPYIASTDFRAVVGSLGLVWLHGPKVYAFRSQKELTAARVTWTHREDPSKTGAVTIVASTWEIILNSFNDLTKTYTYDMEEDLIAEGQLVEITPGGLVSLGIKETSINNAPDAFSSGT